MAFHFIPFHSMLSAVMSSVKCIFFFFCYSFLCLLLIKMKDEGEDEEKCLNGIQSNKMAKCWLLAVSCLLSRWCVNEDRCHQYQITQSFNEKKKKTSHTKFNSSEYWAYIPLEQTTPSHPIQVITTHKNFCILCMLNFYGLSVRQFQTNRKVYFILWFLAEI